MVLSIKFDYLSSCNLHCCDSCPCFYALVCEIKLIYHHTLPPTQDLTTHQTIVPLYTLIPYHSMLSLNQLILNSYSIPSSTSNICTHTPNTLSFFSPHRHPTSIPHNTPQYPGWVPANDRGAQLRMTIIFFYGK